METRVPFPCIILAREARGECVERFLHSCSSASSSSESIQYPLYLERIFPRNIPRFTDFGTVSSASDGTQDAAKRIDLSLLQSTTRRGQRNAISSQPQRRISRLKFTWQGERSPWRGPAENSWHRYSQFCMRNRPHLAKERRGNTLFLRPRYARRETRGALRLRPSGQRFSKNYTRQRRPTAGAKNCETRG